MADLSESSIATNIPHSQSKFKQQRIPACRPFLNPCMAAIIYGVFTLIALTFGLLYFLSSGNLAEHVYQYDQICLNDTCTLTVQFENNIKAPVFIYYQLEKVYQNNFLYSSSRSWDQLQGKYVKPDKLDKCEPRIARNNNITIDNVMVPCGSVASSVFNDAFTFPSNFPDISSDDIVLPSFKKIFKEHNKEYNNSYVWLRDEQSYHDLFPLAEIDPRFLNWIQIAAFSKFRKLWGKVRQDIPAGTYNITIVNNFNVHNFGGTKSLIFAQVGWMGGKNNFFGIFFLAIAGASLIAALIFVILYYTNALPLYRALATAGASIELPLLS